MIKEYLTKKKRIVFFANCLQYFHSHRLGLAHTCKEIGLDVFIVYGDLGSINIEKNNILKRFKLIQCPFERGGLNPFREILSLIKIIKLFKKLKPDLVHLINIKPYLYGGFAAKLLKIPSLTSITGLGYTNDRKNVFYSFYKFIIISSLKFVFNRPKHNLIVQNNDDKEYLIKNFGVKKRNIFLIKGTGINLAKYQYKPLPPLPLIIVLPARLIKEKGVVEFVEAAKIVKKKYKKVKFLLLGNIDNKCFSSIKSNELEKWEQLRLIESLGFTENISSVFEKVHIVCLPSYQEGFPRVLIEASACGRAVITTDVPGCREAIIPHETGLLVKPKNSNDLALKIEWLINRPEEIKNMGKSARNFAEKNFKDSYINKKHLSCYKKFLNL